MAVTNQDPSHADVVSALRIQRDSAHQKSVRLEAHNRALRKHQQEIRDWVAEAIDEFAAARTSEQVLDVADRIHDRAVVLLGDAQRLLEG
jgi:uncharacterized protein YfdQ (DUF2303 family)